ncbi:TlpA family protein disulfide reductase [Aeromicrobium stalagmiti]|uniref:TlpA family protein disulfide reductase n=1 Tax=Aeromicrobium stalagmiti TaxID=2738988 RepID=UPI00156910D8|nr:TlpA disulfide reductase family protein [Aeromicrobium stalagmiti]NRQ51747.1 TlpA family protein disulfide reductase [Aeromicrobium stalagmiti]
MPDSPSRSPRRAFAPNRKARILTAGTCVAALLTLAACGSPEAKPGTAQADAGAAITRIEPDQRKPAPDLAGDDLDGNPISLAAMKGKVVVVNVWGSWCPPCRKEQPVLSKVSTNLRPQGVEFLGIAVRESAATSKAYTDAKQVPYPSISDSGGKLLLGFASSLPAVAVPTTYVIDKQGRVATRLLDVATEATLTSLVTEIVQEP